MKRMKTKLLKHWSALFWSFLTSSFGSPLSQLRTWIESRGINVNKLLCIWVLFGCNIWNCDGFDNVTLLKEIIYSVLHRMDVCLCIFSVSIVMVLCIFPVCDQSFFTELTREASEIVGCFSSRVRHLLHLHISTGVQRYLVQLRKCFKNDQQTLVEEGKMLIEYATMNAIAIRKILKKYDKVRARLCN